MFAGSCIGVILLVCSLEFLRRLGKEYDRYLVRQFERQAYQSLRSGSSDEHINQDRSCSNMKDTSTSSTRLAPKRTFRPTIIQQLTRALLHMLQFGVAYFIMLLAMYYNGYIIICILIGAFVGSFSFNWEKLRAGSMYVFGTSCLDEPSD